MNFETMVILASNKEKNGFIKFLYVYKIIFQKGGYDRKIFMRSKKNKPIHSYFYSSKERITKKRGLL
jgi:hypothetical protein